jgi:hypothetical protein
MRHFIFSPNGSSFRFFYLIFFSDCIHFFFFFASPSSSRQALAAGRAARDEGAATDCLRPSPLTQPVWRQRIVRFHSISTSIDLFIFILDFELSSVFYAIIV